MFYLYRHPIYDEEKQPVFIGEFNSKSQAEAARNKHLDDDWFFESDFYIVDDS